MLEALQPVISRLLENPAGGPGSGNHSPADRGRERHDAEPVTDADAHLRGLRRKAGRVDQPGGHPPAAQARGLAARTTPHSPREACVLLESGVLGSLSRPSPALRARRAGRPCRHSRLSRDQARHRAYRGGERCHAKRAVFADGANIRRGAMSSTSSFQTTSSCSRPSRSQRATRTRSRTRSPIRCWTRSSRTTRTGASPARRS